MPHSAQCVHIKVPSGLIPAEVRMTEFGLCARVLVSTAERPTKFIQLIRPFDLIDFSLSLLRLGTRHRLESPLTSSTRISIASSSFRITASILHPLDSSSTRHLESSTRTATSSPATEDKRRSNSNYLNAIYNQYNVLKDVNLSPSDLNRTKESQMNLPNLQAIEDSDVIISFDSQSKCAFELFSAVPP